METGVVSFLFWSLFGEIFLGARGGKRRDEGSDGRLASCVAEAVGSIEVYRGGCRATTGMESRDAGFGA